MGIVYKILCNETGECYVGSANTHKDYINRKSRHRSLTSGTLSKQIIERNNYEFSVIEENIFINIELRKREQIWIDKTSNTLNQYKSFCNEEQHVERNRLNHAKKYQKNKELLQEKILCECGSIITRNSLLRHFKTEKHQNYLNGSQ